MTDRVYPSSKPTGTAAAAKPTATATATASTNPPSFPAPKSQLYNPTRQPYRPTPNNYNHRRRSGRRCFCLCCFWSFLVIIAVLLLAAIAGAAVYVLYRPRRPSFSVSALRISQFNLSATPADDTTHLFTKLSLTLSSTNTNKKLVFFYDPISISAQSNQVQIANGSFPGFTSTPNNITIIHTSLTSASQVLDAESVTSLRSDLKRKSGLPLNILLDTKMVVKMDGLKSKKVGIRVTCEGIGGLIPKGKSPAVANTDNAKCKVDLRLKIWKWTF